MVDIKAIRARAEQKKEEQKENAGKEFYPFLDMDPGDELVFRVENIRPSTFANAKEGDVLYDVIDIQSKEKDGYTLRSQKALMNQLQKEAIGVGEFGYMKYEGEVKSKNSSYKYKSYIVIKLSQQDVGEIAEVKKTGGRPKKTE